MITREKRAEIADTNEMRTHVYENSTDTNEKQTTNVKTKQRNKQKK